MAEWWYNINYHLSIRMSHFEILYGYPPSKLLNYIPGTINNQVVEQHLKDRIDILQTIKRNLKKAQDIQKSLADQKRKE